MHVQAAGYTMCNPGNSAHEVNTLLFAFKIDTAQGRDEL